MLAIFLELQVMSLLTDRVHGVPSTCTHTHTHNIGTLGCLPGSHRSRARRPGTCAGRAASSHQAEGPYAEQAGTFLKVSLLTNTGLAFTPEFTHSQPSGPFCLAADFAPPLRKQKIMGGTPRGGRADRHDSEPQHCLFPGEPPRACLSLVVLLQTEGIEQQDF